MFRDNLLQWKCVQISKQTVHSERERLFYLDVCLFLLHIKVMCCQDQKGEGWCEANCATQSDCFIFLDKKNPVTGLVHCHIYLCDVGQANYIRNKADDSNEDLSTLSEGPRKFINQRSDEAFHSAELQSWQSHFKTVTNYSAVTIKLMQRFTTRLKMLHQGTVLLRHITV